METNISRSALGGSLEQFPISGIGTTASSFSNKSPQPARRKRRIAAMSVAKPANAVKNVQQVYRKRFIAHASLIGLVASLVIANNPTNAHNLSVRLMASGVSDNIALDEISTAQIAADMATKSQLIVTSEASKTAVVKSEQVALLTSDETALAKRQVVSTAGDVTRETQKYAVLPGDTLSDVATKFNVTTSTIKWANDLSDTDTIVPGENLTILPVSGLTHTVAAGDTADSLAEKYKSNAAQILSFNNAEVKGLPEGQSIVIPDGIKPEVPKPVATVRVASTQAVIKNNVAGAATAASPALTNFIGGANSYAYGYCTFYVASRRSVPSMWGNARNWLYNAQAAGFSTGSVPVPGAIAWTGAGYYGHVAYVESVSGNTVVVSEMNFNGNWNRVTTRTASASSFSYIY